MRSELVISLLFQIFSLIFAQDCNLPNGQKSTCVRLQHCEHFSTILKKFGANPPLDVIQNIKQHQCPKPGGTVCCPNENTEVAPPSNLMSSNEIVDYRALRSHRNYNLLNERKCGQSTSDRITGGWDAQIREIPWLALLGYLHRQDFEINWSCGGALITPRYVLTAAHCITRDMKKIRFGEHTLSKEKDCDDFGSCADPVQDIEIEKFIKHPEFNRYKKENDIALIKLASPADITRNNVKTICVPIEADDDIEKIFKKSQKPNPMTICGFGKIGDSFGQADILQKAFVPYVEQDVCQTKYGAYKLSVHKKQFCAGGINATDTCKGDSGGPISNLGSKPRMMLYGVVVGGVACGESSQLLPGIYTDIRYYLPWILDNISE